jgi:diacylglycerol kinase family enzyme
VRVLLVVNPFASSVTPRGRVIIQKALAADHELTVVETSRRGHATRFAQDAAQRGLDVVAVLGGDGTLNEAANGLVRSACALAPLPGGSTNVFARSIGLPNDPVEATAVTVESLARRSIRPVGVGFVNGRVVLFHAGFGFDAAVVAEVERRGALKRWAGHPLFVAAALRTWFRGYDHRRPRLAIGTDTGVEVPDARFAIVLNTSPYTFLGNRPLNLAPKATLDSPLSLVAFRSLRASMLLPALGKVVMGGRLPKRRAIVAADGLDKIRLEAYGSVPYQIDGDFLGEADTFDLHHEPRALRLVVP